MLKEAIEKIPSQFFCKGSEAPLQEESKFFTTGPKPGVTVKRREFAVNVL